MPLKSTAGKGPLPHRQDARCRIKSANPRAVFQFPTHYPVHRELIGQTTTFDKGEGISSRLGRSHSDLWEHLEVGRGFLAQEDDKIGCHIRTDLR